MILVDSCIFIDVLENDPDWVDWSLSQLDTWSQRGPVVVNPVIYAELAACATSKEALERELSEFGAEFRELPRDALFLAGQAHAMYRRRGGTRSGVLADFLIGAHAATGRFPLLTRDRRRYAAYFPTLQLVTP